MIRGIEMVAQELPLLMSDRDRHGNVRFYVRSAGHAKIRIRETPGTHRFLEVYQAAMREVGAADETATGERTWKWLCKRYLGDAEVKAALGTRTLRVRSAILEKTWAEPLKPDDKLTFGTCPVSRMTVRHVRTLRDRKAAFPEAANGRLKAIRQVFTFGLKVEPETCRSNPARDVNYLPTYTTGHHTWTVEEVAQYEAFHPMGTMARMTLAVLLFTGQRRSDVVLFGRQHERPDGSLLFTQVKGRRRKPVTIEIPILPELRAVIDATPRAGLSYIETEFKRPFTANGFGNRFRKWCDEAGLPHCSAHGLRKAGATIAAENGATETQLMSIFGWTTSKQVTHYTKAVNQKKSASGSMHLLVPKPKKEA